MTFSTKTIATLAFAAMAASHGAAPVRAGDTSISVGPAKGITMLVGTKRAVGYYVADAGACDLTLLVAEKFLNEDTSIPTATRVRSVIGAGTTAHVETIDGASLAFTCATGAKSMTIEKYDRVAYHVPRS
jgi:hypothetical protein